MDIKTKIGFWRNLDITKTPYVFSGDLEPVKGRSITPDINSYNDYIERLGEIKQNPDKFHLGLLPIPYLGNLETAKIFILLANPGLGATDYKGEYGDNKYRQKMINNLRQENFDDFPFVLLNPEFAWHGGFEYWERKFSPIINNFVSEKKITYLEALRLISKNVTALELIPYHSKIGNGISNLQSTRIIKDYVLQVLKPRAQKGDIEIIVTRKTAEWGLQNEKHIIVYQPNQARSSSLNIETEGGKCILRRLISISGL